MRLLGNMNHKEGELYIGETSVKSLAAEYGTPLYIIDRDDFLQKCRTFRDSFQGDRIQTRILYASKAMLNVYTAQLIKNEGLSIDVVSGGELYTVLKAGFPPKKIFFHGNNKLDEELKYALEAGVGTIVVDNRQEFERLSRLMKERDKIQDILLRVNPGIEAHTHDYIATSKTDSKFGESTYDPEIFEIIKTMGSDPKIHLKGLHCHIGSQIFEIDTFLKTAKAMMDFTKEATEKTGLTFTELNLGGGFGVYYTEEDKPFDVAPYLKKLIAYIEAYDEEIGLGLERVDIEPGRSLINESGSTLYTVGGTKETIAGRAYIFIDGGMTDNPRPALYQAKYEAILANKADLPPEKLYTIAGKCCESGDVLIRDIMMPVAEIGDLLLISSTGAYTFSMASQYNRNPRPAMVFVGKEGNTLAVRRQTYEDLIAGDVIHEGGIS